MHVCFTQIKERVSAALGYSLLAKTVSCAVSVVIGRSCSRRSRYKPCTKRDKCFCGYSWDYQQPLFGKSICYFSTFEKIKLPRLKSIPAEFCKLNRHYSVSLFLVSIVSRIRTRKCMKLLRKIQRIILCMRKRCSQYYTERKTGEKWGRPGNIHHVNDVRWTWGGQRGGRDPTAKATYWIICSNALPQLWPPDISVNETTHHDQ